MSESKKTGNPWDMRKEERDFFLMAGDILSAEERKDVAAGKTSIDPGERLLRFSANFGAGTAPTASAEAPKTIREPAPVFYAPGGFSKAGDLPGAATAKAPKIPDAPARKPAAAEPTPAGSGYKPAAVRRVTEPRPDRAPAIHVAIRKKTVRFGKKTLLRDVKFDAGYGDFMLILGGSGAGKTTLVRAILGESKADGKVLLDGNDLYSDFKKLKYQIGLVPQFLTLRVNDTVRNTVMDAARIKLDRMFSVDEIAKRVDSVLRKVGIKELENSLICNLSGGQKKKVAVAVQLVGFQKIFICDEPDSGLDAASRQQLMDILKEISDSGKIVMIITHYPDDAIRLFTKIVVIAKSSADKAGHLAYCGNVADALSFFGVSQLQAIMKEINPRNEGGAGRADFFIGKYAEGVRR